MDQAPSFSEKRKAVLFDFKAIKNRSLTDRNRFADKMNMYAPSLFCLGGNVKHARQTKNEHKHGGGESGRAGEKRAQG